MRTGRASRACVSLLLAAGTLRVVVAHDHDVKPTADMGSGHVGHNVQSNWTAAPAPDSYFNHSESAGWIYAHIALMTLGWTVILPLAVMISAARSRLAIPIQFAFLLVNALGIFTSIVYDARTPDLYPSNSHHKIGWVITWVAVAWVALGLSALLRSSKDRTESVTTISPVTTQHLAQYLQLDNNYFVDDCRLSRDSGQGTERNSASLCSGSRSSSAESIPQKPELPNDEDYNNYDNGTDERRGFLDGSSFARSVPHSLLRVSSKRLVSAIDITYVILERLQLLFGFLAITTGLVTWASIFHGDGLFNGLAHWIKGGIFFWYGLLTLGRWMGGFTDFGWAWNVRPGRPLVSQFAARVPSAEFVESFVIFFYGASNVFLEHLTGWGKAWTMVDLEHISITVMFFFGGLLGMLIESKIARGLLNTNILLKQYSVANLAAQSEAQDEWKAPDTYQTSLNPMPGLIILLLGVMMSSHHQASMTSTMIHSQWGTLFVGFALARAVTYLLLFLKPPTSYFPSRPPSELVASFCLVSGGLIFMASTRDVVTILDRNNLDAMFIFTVTMGLTSLLMAWTVVLYAIKCWANRREAQRVTETGS